MGCTFSRSSERVGNPRIFKVYNVDDSGQELSGGHMEISDTDLILHQKGKEPIHWPLRSLRRYGFDAELFSFESGRRCPTGHGIYAFKCRRAEALFNLLQECLQRAGEDQTHTPRPGSTTVPPTTTVEPAVSRPASLLDQHPPVPNGTPSYAPLTYTNVPLFQPPSTTPAAPATAQQLTPAPPLSNGDTNGSNSHEYVNTTVVTSTDRAHVVDMTNVEVNIGSLKLPDAATTEPLNYAELDLVAGATGGAGVDVGGDFAASQATYVNVPPAEPVSTRSAEQPTNSLALPTPKDDGHSYANLDLFQPAPTTTVPPPKLQTRTRPVNYIQLDLHNLQDNHSNGVNPPSSPISLASSNPESPVRKTISGETQSYATIDFNRTAALSNSAKPGGMPHHDEGSRKTRHNSNIEDIA